MSDEATAVETVELTADEKVRNGANFLDQAAVEGIVPEGWRGLVDLDKLRVRGNDECVLGQIFNRTHDAEHTGWGWAVEKFGHEIEQEDLGFNVAWQWGRLDTDARWTALDEAWKRYLTKETDASGADAGVV